MPSSPKGEEYREAFGLRDKILRRRTVPTNKKKTHEKNARVIIIHVDVVVAHCDE